MRINAKTINYSDNKYIKKQYKTSFVVYISIILIWFSNSACKKQTLGADKSKSVENQGISSLPVKKDGLKILKDGVYYKYLTSKMGLMIEMEDQSISTNATLRIESGKKIWVSVQKIGFEVARVLFTQDSVFMVDNFHQQYVSTTYQKLSSFTGVMIDLSLVEAMMIGRAVPNTGWQPTSNVNVWQNLLGPYILSAKTDSLNSPCLSSYSASGTSQGQPIVFIADFGQTKKVLGDLYVPYTKKFSIQTPNKVSLTGKKQAFSIEHRQISLPNEAPDFSFRIPDSYAAIDLER